MYREAFNKTLEHFQLSARDIAAKSNLQEAAVSSFRTGRKDVNISTWERLEAALPEDAREYMHLQILIGNISNRGISVILSTISTRIMKESQAEELLMAG
jgi:hypothetical protein